MLKGILQQTQLLLSFRGPPKELDKFSAVRFMCQEGLPKTISENLQSKLKLAKFSLVSALSLPWFSVYLQGANPGKV